MLEKMTAHMPHIAVFALDCWAHQYQLMVKSELVQPLVALKFNKSESPRAQDPTTRHLA